MMQLDDEARRLLELTRDARAPSDADKLRVERLLAKSIHIGAVTAAGATVGKSASAAAAAKWTAFVAIPAFVAAVAYQQSRPDPAPASVVAAVSARAAVSTASSVSPSAVPPSAPPPVSIARTAPAESSRGPVPPARTENSLPRTRAEVPADSLNSELDLLHEAQVKWRNRKPAEALALLAQHRQQYPRSALGPEREALRVLSLCAAGRTKDAKEVARQASKSLARSPLRGSIEQSCIKE